jgi:hypothetical protein
VYPATGAGALPNRIYVEGVNPTSRTITPGNTIQATPTPDNTITLSYFVVTPVMPGGGIPLVPVGTAQVSVGVTPVVQFFTVNNLPTPPNPLGNPPPRTDGQVGFSDGRSIQSGYETFAVNSAGNRVPGRYAATFNAQVFNANARGASHFVQNEKIINGAGPPRGPGGGGGAGAAELGVAEE